MKKILALFAALAMGLCLVGCASTPAEEPVSEEETTTDDAYQELLEQMFGGTIQDASPSLEVTVHWQNSEELLTFISDVSAQQPSQYTAVREMTSYTTTYKVDYKVNTASLDIAVETADETQEKHYDDVALAVYPLNNFYVSEEGQLDVMTLYSLGLYDWFEQNPEIFYNCVYVLTAQTAEGELYAVDYYLDTQTAEAIKGMLAGADTEN